LQLYSGMSREFVEDSVRNRIAEKLSTAFFDYNRYKAGPAEINSWRNSLRAMATVMERAKLRDHGVFLEYQLPLSSLRLDCMICGHDRDSRQNAVVVELKQWESCGESDAENLVETWVGGARRDVPHPSVQVGQYRQYLMDGHESFHDGPEPVVLSACCYLHNYSIKPDDALLAEKFQDRLRQCPVYAGEAIDELSGFLVDRLSEGRGRKVLDRIERGRYRPGRQLMAYVAETIKSHSPWVLLDEQLVVFEKIMAAARRAARTKTKRVVLVRGGPGTGKSVIAINLLAELMRHGVHANYATGSKAFTETLWQLVGSRSKPVFRYFNSYSRADENSIDVLICDEAHRIRATSANRFTKKELRTNKPQIRELLESAKLSVFFIDDRQVVRPNEIG